jgi:hypothetical protein
MRGGNEDREHRCPAGLSLGFGRGENRQRLRPEARRGVAARELAGWGPASIEKRLRPERGAESPRESWRGWGPRQH